MEDINKEIILMRNTVEVKLNFTSLIEYTDLCKGNSMIRCQKAGLFPKYVIWLLLPGNWYIWTSMRLRQSIVSKFAACLRDIVLCLCPRQMC